MNDMLQNAIEDKVRQTIQNMDEICRMAAALQNDTGDSFILGVVSGRLYNSFYYQSRRLQGRDPTPQEFDEFLVLLHKAKADIAAGITAGK